MQQLATRPWITAGITLVGAGLIAVTPVTVPLPGVQVSRMVQLISDEADITLDLVRHGQSQDNVDGILGTVPPGAPLTADGVLEADAVAPVITDKFPDEIAGIYSSTLLRAQETAVPLAQLLGLQVTDLPGLNEVNAGILEGTELNTFTEIGYVLPQLMWILGLYCVPMLGSTIDPNGMAFEDRFSDAVQTIYGNTVNDGDGKLTDVAFSHAGAIAAWTLMNVKNPDFSLVLNELIDTHNPLTNTGQVVLEGNPTDGWTLVSWDGTPVGAADLGTELFVDFRNLITAPQMALWHIWEAIQGGDPTTITNAVQTGFDQVGAALAQFPESVFNDIAAAFQAGTDAGGQLAGEASSIVGDTLAAL